MKLRVKIQHLIIASLVSIITSSCNLSGVRRIDVVDIHSKPINNIIVVPISDYKSFGVRHLSIRKPFMFNSGDNIIKEHIQHKGAIVGPGLSLGPPPSNSAWIFLKSGYSPLKVYNGTIETNSYIDKPEDGDSPIVLEFGDKSEYSIAVDVLIGIEQHLTPSQAKLRDRWRLSNATIDPESRAFLKSHNN